MLKTKFTELTGCKVPIQMAAIGSLARPPLAAAVSNGGGLGMIQLSGFTPSQATRSLEEVRKRTRGVFGANFIVAEAWYPDLEELREVVETASKHAKVVEFFYRQPDSVLVELVHRNGALASWQVGSNDEAVAAAKAGCDLVVAQGIEAGGHIRGKIGLLSLLDQVLDSVDVPVLAAGGIGSGRAMAAALAAGASGVRVGTRFIAAEEAEAHPQYQKALIEAEPEDTVVTEVFSENWPNAPHRVLRSSVEASKPLKRSREIS
jgi:NAD(P)H-dependent flavin oxidoreductase YrpB (nitropropane dioxygenase family)